MASSDHSTDTSPNNSNSNGITHDDFHRNEKGKEIICLSVSTWIVSALMAPPNDNMGWYIAILNGKTGRESDIMNPRDFDRGLWHRGGPRLELMYTTSIDWTIMFTSNSERGVWEWQPEITKITFVAIRGHSWPTKGVMGDDDDVLRSWAVQRYNVDQ